MMDKKEKLREYQRNYCKSEKNNAVYAIKNIINEKIYVGSTISFSHRKSHHIHKLKRNLHRNRYMQEDFNKYGIKAFEFIILHRGVNKNKLISLEIEEMSKINQDKLYNIMKSKNGRWFEKVDAPMPRASLKKAILQIDHGVAIGTF